jgi:hypothetical protein
LLFFTSCFFATAQSKYITKLFAFAIQGIGGAQPVNDNGEPIERAPMPINYKIYFTSPYTKQINTIFLYTKSGTFYEGTVRVVTEQPVKMYNGEQMVPKQKTTLYEVAFTQIDLAMLPAAVKSFLQKNEGVLTYMFKKKLQLHPFKTFVKKTIMYP